MSINGRELAKSILLKVLTAGKLMVGRIVRVKRGEIVTMMNFLRFNVFSFLFGSFIVELKGCKGDKNNVKFR